MEFLRFGSSIPGSYWGCCACDIIQNFKVDPDAKASIQISSGDGGGGIGDKFLGGTWKDIFLQRLRFGTFTAAPMPNHAFIAILTNSQILGDIGKKWLAILREQGFEFVRRVDNSVYSGENVSEGKEPSQVNDNNANFIFMLVRNVGTGSFKDQFTPPEAWTNLPKVIDEAWEHIEAPKELTSSIFEKQRSLFNALPKPVFFTEVELDKNKIPVTYSGIRTGGPYPNVYLFREGAPQETRENRKKRENERLELRSKPLPASYFPVKESIQAVSPAPLSPATNDSFTDLA